VVYDLKLVRCRIESGEVDTTRTVFYRHEISSSNFGRSCHVHDLKKSNRLKNLVIGFLGFTDILKVMFCGVQVR
jgi:hypothetical protein